MSGFTRKLLREWAPPAVVRRLQSRFGAVRFHGNYPTWSAANADCKGYASGDILQRVLSSALAVKSGRAAFERDSVLFDEPQYPWQLLATLLWIAASNQGRLSVLDFGGSLGSTYFQCKGFLQGLDQVHWSIVEQPHFVAAGREHVENEILRFHSDIEASIAWRKPDVILFGSVLQYLEEPHALLAQAAGFEVPFLLIDRTPLISADADRLTVQKVPPRIYEASYPAWFLSRSKLLRTVSPKYELKEEYSCEDRANIPSEYKGLIFKRKAAIG
jgi:putative methyltransferase (TIGR04325 family)